ncbi:MAG: aminotransferase class IV [Proteobacteria bacterium]|nr:aminotransferase class IV [Pseudomonadota bacterium]MBI3499837.1 aminotransferase class IV [Pseudomonadota bacterium]
MTALRRSTDPARPALADPAAGVAFIEGAYVPITEAKISILDFGFTRSDVTYDVVHVWNGRFFRLDRHLERFQNSMRTLRMSLPYGKDDIRRILSECVKRTGLKNAFVAMVCTRGRPEPGSRDPRTCTNQFIAYAIPFVWIADLERQEKGLQAIISARPRIPALSVDPTVKNYHWLDMVMSLFEAYDKGAEIPILLDLDGNVAEGPGFNAFCVRDGKVLTPDQGMLEGITRRTMLDLCKGAGLALEVRKVSVQEFRDADEIFLSSTAGGVIPIVTLDRRIYGNGVPGPVTMQLRKLYWAKHDQGWEGTPIDYD